MNRSNQALVAFLALGIAAVSVYLATVGRSPKLDLDTYNVLGAVTAEETAKLLGNKGEVLVMARGSGDVENPAVETELDAFKDTLRKHREMKVAVEKVELAPVQMMATGGGIPVNYLLSAVQKHPKISGLVLFLGLPPLHDSELEALRKLGVKIVLVSAFQPDVLRLLELGAVHLAILPKEESSAGSAPARTVRERFDREYTILTRGGNARRP